MKQLIVIIGPNGVGKSTTAKEILKKRPHTAYVDSDWCRMMNPFEFTEITKQTVEENIYCFLRNYLDFFRHFRYNKGITHMEAYYGKL
jgi:ABC-type Mn2+/Zn2+ transport system ATPase subunit